MKIDEQVLIAQLAKFDKQSRQDVLRNDIQLDDYVIKNVPVYPDYENNPSENVAGDVLSNIYKLISEHADQKIIEYR